MVSQIFLSFLFIFSASFFFGYFLGWSVGGVRRGGSVGGGSVEGVRGPVRKVVHGPGVSVFGSPHSLGQEEYCEIFISFDEENSNESDSESSTESDIDFKGLVKQSESESDLGKVQAKAVMKFPGCKILRTL